MLRRFYLFAVAMAVLCLNVICGKCSCCAISQAEPREIELINLLYSSVPKRTKRKLRWKTQSDIMHTLRHTTRYRRWADVFCGTGGMSAAFMRRTHSPGASLDLTLSEKHDIVSDNGFALFITIMLELVPMAMAVIGLPCSTFVFMSRGTTKRHASNAWVGDENVECVKLANIIAQRIVILCRVLTLRLVQYFIEQPMSSCFFKMECFRRFCAMNPNLGRHGLRLKRKFVWLGHWGHNNPKATVLWGSARALKRLVCKKPNIRATASNAVVRKGSLKWVWLGGKWTQRPRISGIPRKLKQTQVYPTAFCEDVARLSVTSPLR